MAAWLIMLSPLRKQTYQTKWCYNFITGAHEYLSSNTSLGSCERSKVRLRWAWWDVICSIWLKPWSEGHLGRDVCWCIQFEPLTLLAYAQVHTDVGLGCSEHTTQQMTPRGERCCGDWKHGWPESCLCGSSQCDACRKQEEDELLACVVILYHVIQKVPYHAKMTFIRVLY